MSSGEMFFLVLLCSVFGIFALVLAVQSTRNVQDWDKQ